MKRVVALALMAVAFAAQAQDAVTHGDVTVYYSAVPSESIPVEVARQSAITRSPNRALVNLTVLRADATLAASIAGTATNAKGETQVLALREMRAAGAISYLAEPKIAATDTLSFDLVVTPAGGTPIAVKWRQEFFPPVR